MKRYFPRSLLALAITGVLVAGALSAHQSHAQSQVPAGFEELLLGQKEKVDVLLFGQSLGLFDAEVKPDTVQFIHPEQLIRRLIANKRLKPAFQSALTTTLAVPLKRNGHLICGVAQPACGSVKSESVAIIFDDSRQTIELFITSDWLLAGETAQKYYQADEGHNALIHSQLINWSLSDGYSNISARGTGALGLGNSRYLAGNWDSVLARTNQQTHFQTQMQDLYLRQDLGKNHYLQAGRMDQTALSGPLGGNFDFSLLPMPLFIGARAGTTQAWRNTQSTGESATLVTLLLNRDARVDIYRGNQLLGSQYLTAGMQTLNTSALPGGSYPLQLRIYENDTLVRTEQAAFSKSAGGFGGDKTEWFMQAGQLVASRTPDMQGGKQSWQSGVRTPLSRTTMLSSGVSSLGDSYFNETRLDWQTAFRSSTLGVSTAWLTGKGGVRGNAQQITLNNGVSWSLYRQQQRGSTCRGQQGYEASGCSDTLSASVSTQLAGWTASLGHTRSKQLPTPQPIQHNLPWQLTYDVNPKSSVQQTSQLGLARSKIWGNLSASGRVGLFHSRQQEGNDRGAFISVSLGNIARPSASAARNRVTNMQTDYRVSQCNGAQQSWSLSHLESTQGDVFLEASIGISGNQQGDMSAQSGGRLDGRYGNLNATLSRSQLRQQPPQQSLTGGYDSTLITTGSEFWLGTAGNGMPSGAALVRVAGSSDALSGPAVEITSAGRSVTLGLGETIALPLAGWQESSTDIQEANQAGNPLFASLGQGAGQKPYFVLPGRVVTREVSAGVVYTLVGRAIHNGGPLSNGLALNADNTRFDEQGSFMLDSPTLLKTLYVLRQQQFYSCSLSQTQKRAGIYIAGEIACQKVELAALPVPLQQHQLVKNSQ